MIVGEHGAGRPARWVGLALAACGVVVLVFHATHGGRVTYDLVAGGWREEAEAVEDRLRCLAERVEELVPPGSRVHVGPGPGVELQQRVSELVVYAGGEVVPDPARADLVLDAAADDGTGCDGLTLAVVARA